MIIYVSITTSYFVLFFAGLLIICSVIALYKFNTRNNHGKVTNAGEIIQKAIDLTPESLLITDLKGNIIFANQYAANLLNLSIQALQVTQIQSFINPDCLDELTEQRIKEELKSTYLPVNYPPTTEQPISKNITTTGRYIYNKRNLPTQIIFTLHDIPRRHPHETQLLSLNRIITEVVQIRDPQVLLQTILTSSEEILRASASAIYLLNSDDHSVKQSLTHNIVEEYANRISQGNYGLPGEMLMIIRKPTFIEDVLNDPVYHERSKFLSNYGIRALLIIPILFHDQYLGAMAVYYDQPHHFLEPELQLAMTLGHTLAIALQNANLYLAERSQRQLAEALAKAAASLNSSLMLDEVLDQILAQTMNVAYCRSTNVMLIEGEYAYLVRRMGYEGLPERVGHLQNYRYPLNYPTLQHMIKTRQPILIPDTINDPRWTRIAGTDWIRSHAGVPLHVNDQVVGFLNIDSEHPGFFTDDTTHRLQAVASHAALAIRNAQLYEDSRRQAAELSTLIDAATAVSTNLDYNQVLQVIAQRMTKLVNAETCVISDFDAQHLKASPLVVFSTSQSEPDAVLPPERMDFSLISSVLKDSHPVQLHLDDPQLDPAGKSFLAQAGTATVLFFPLIVKDQTIGFVELGSKDSHRIFTAREITLLQTLGAHAAVSIQNARLYQSVQRHALELEDHVRERTIELQSAKERTEVILASQPDAVFILNENDYPLQANEVGEALLIQAIQQGEDLFAAEFLRGLKNGDLMGENAILKVYGRSYQAVASTFPIDKQRNGLVLVYRDVTRFQELDQMKTQFVSDVSHELRTPLTNLTLYLDLLSALEIPTKGLKYLETLRRETRRLTHLIEDLLTISRLEAGRMKFALTPIDVNTLITDLVEDRAMMAARRSLSLRFEPTDDLPPALADPNLLNQALSSLLTNALNYTPADGEVCIHTRTREDSEITWVTIDISDTGVGIAPDELPRIFDRFFRGSAGRQTGAPGTGLGLSISREIADRMGGRITVQSKLAEGSVFTVWLKAVL